MLWKFGQNNFKTETPAAMKQLWFLHRYDCKHFIGI